MKDVLERLTRVDGIHAAALFDADGTFLSAAGADDSSQRLARCHVRVRAAFGDRTSIVARTAYATVARFEHGTLVVRCGPHAMLVVLGERDLDLSPEAAGFHIAVALKVINVRASSRRPGPVSQLVSVIDDELSAHRLRAPAVPKISS